MTVYICSSDGRKFHGQTSEANNHDEICYKPIEIPV